MSREIGIYPPNNCRCSTSAAAATAARRCSRRPTCSCSTPSRWPATSGLQVSLNVLNLFNQDTAVGKYSTYQKINGVAPDEALFYTGQQTLGQLIASQNVVKDPRFLMDNAFQAPIAARFGVKFLF